jgi:hypothetical protein
LGLRGRKVLKGLLECKALRGHKDLRECKAQRALREIPQVLI